MDSLPNDPNIAGFISARLNHAEYLSIIDRDTLWLVAFTWGPKAFAYWVAKRLGLPRPYDRFLPVTATDKLRESGKTLPDMISLWKEETGKRWKWNKRPRRAATTMWR